MKLSTLKAATARHDEGAVLELVDETGEPYLATDGSPATMTIVGSESKRIRQVEDRQTKRVYRELRTSADPELLRRNRLELAAAAVIAWHGIEDDNGAEIPCTPENVKEVLSAAGHLLTQVEAGVRRHASFFAPTSGA